MGLTCVSVVSSAVSVFAVTRLPSERSARPVMPQIGAVTRRVGEVELGFVELAPRAEAIAAVDWLCGGERLVELALR